MNPPFRPFPAAPRGCGGDGCSSGRDPWPLHHVHHNGVFCRLCSSCVLLYNASLFCSSCLLLLPSADHRGGDGDDMLVSHTGPTAACSLCRQAVAHLSCLTDPAAAASFVCPACAAAAEGRTFSYTPAGGRRALDARAARVLLVAARLAHASVERAAAAARAEAELRVRDAAAARKRAREMLDAAFRVAEAETKNAKNPKPASGEPPKKKAGKGAEANRDRDKLLKFNAMQQPPPPPLPTHTIGAGDVKKMALAAAAAASSMPLPLPSSREEKKPPKPETQGAAAERAVKDDQRALFGGMPPLGGAS